MLKAEPGKGVPYCDLEAATGKRLATFRGALQTARRQVLREEAIVFGVERGVGLRRLTNDEIVTSVADRKALGRHTRRAAQRLRAADYASLCAAKQLLSTATMSIFLAIRSQLTDRAVQTVQVLGSSAKHMPIRETLTALLRSQRQEN